MSLQNDSTHLILMLLGLSCSGVTKTSQNMSERSAVGGEKTTSFHFSSKPFAAWHIFQGLDLGPVASRIGCNTNATRGNGATALNEVPGSRKDVKVGPGRSTTRHTGRRCARGGDSLCAPALHAAVLEGGKGIIRVAARRALRWYPSGSGFRQTNGWAADLLIGRIPWRSPEPILMVV